MKDDASNIPAKVSGVPNVGIRSPFHTDVLDLDKVETRTFDLVVSSESGVCGGSKPKVQFFPTENVRS